MKFRIASICLTSSALVVATSRVAQADVVTCECTKGARRHDGFFLRSAPGLVLMTANVSDADWVRRRTRIEGIGLSSALTIGATPFRGVVVGGRVWTANLSPRFVEAGKTVTPDDDSVKVTLLRLGPFVDWYPYPRAGFHTLAEAAWALMIERDTKGRPSKPVAMGISAGIQSGYEWFVAKELSFGFLGGFAFGYVSRSYLDGRESAVFLSPELTLTATYH